MFVSIAVSLYAVRPTIPRCPLDYSELSPTHEGTAGVHLVSVASYTAAWFTPQTVTDPNTNRTITSLAYATKLPSGHQKYETVRNYFKN